MNKTEVNTSTLSEMEFDIACEVISGWFDPFTGAKGQEECSEVAQFDIIFHSSMTCEPRHKFSCSDHLSRILEYKCEFCNLPESERIISCNTIKP